MSTWEGNSTVGIGASQITVCGKPAEIGDTGVSINATTAEQWGTGLVGPFITYANLIGAKWNLNPRLILGIIGVETGFELTTSQGENVISAPQHLTGDWMRRDGNPRNVFECVGCSQRRSTIPY